MMTMARPSAARNQVATSDRDAKTESMPRGGEEGETVGSAGDGELVGPGRGELTDRAGDRGEAEQFGPGFEEIDAGRGNQGGGLEEEEGAGHREAQGEEGGEVDAGSGLRA